MNSRKSIMNLLLTLICIVGLFCCQSKKEYSYYENGKIKSVNEVLNGVSHIEYRTYYSSGAIKSVEAYKNDKLHGIVEHFYENGELKSKANWANGKESGLGEGYYESESKLFEATYDSGKIVGYSKVFYESGGLKEKKLYDSLGEICYIVLFDKEGKLQSHFVRPRLHAVKDTVNTSEESQVAISYGLKLTGIIRISAMQIDSLGNIETEKYIFESEGSQSTVYRHTFSKPGRYKLVFKFSHYDQLPGDTLSIDRVQGNCEIVVVDKLSQRS